MYTALYTLSDYSVQQRPLQATDTIINWLNDNVTKEDIEGSYNNDIAEEMKYFNRSDYIKNAIMKQFPDTSEGLCDTISDKYIDSIFNM